MKTATWLIVFILCTQFAIGQVTPNTCAKFTTSVTAINALEPADTQQHTITGPLAGLHAWGITPVSTCTYTPGSHTPNCNVSCDITASGATSFNPLGGIILVETGSLTVAGTHMVAGGWNPGHSVGVNSGANCTGVVEAVAVNCLGTSSACVIGVTLTGGGATFTTNATTVWDSKPVPTPLNCPAAPDPQFVPTPTPPIIPICTKPQRPIIQDDPGQPGTPGDCIPSPIIIDLAGNGFELTDAAHGVLFDIGHTGTPIQISWTANANNAFLVLDRDGNGQITDGGELFGNFTSQPTSSTPNGFLALAVYDLPANGGNGDGVIDAKDAVFSKLRLWVDANHDGISQAEELHTLPEMGVVSINLNYYESGHTDQYGNAFRFAANINQGQAGASSIGQKAVDVFLVMQ